jgi:recombination protein RecA
MARVRKEARSIAKLAERFASQKQAESVLEEVRGVPTRFIQLDYATRVGGFPIERVAVMHGPSNEGKTALALGIIGSFLDCNHFAKLFDAERTTDKVWARKLIGDHIRHPRFFASRPDTYEDAISDTRRYANALRTAVEEREVPPDTFGFMCVDSMRRLVPKGLLDKIMKEDPAKGDVKVHDRRAQQQAAANAAWLDELVPLADNSQMGVLLITREFDDPDADQNARAAGRAYKVGGGKGLIYDSSLLIRVERDPKKPWVGTKAEVSEATGRVTKEAEVYGERHKCTIRKTKIGEKDGKTSVFYFHTSNGLLPGVPFGFDRARDVLDLALRFNLVKQAGSSYSFRKQRIGQGEHNAVRRLTSDKKLLDEIDAECRSLFFKPGYDPETGEVTE